MHFLRSLPGVPALPHAEQNLLPGRHRRRRIFGGYGFSRGRIIGIFTRLLGTAQGHRAELLGDGRGVHGGRLLDLFPGRFYWRKAKAEPQSHPLWLPKVARARIPNSLQTSPTANFDFGSPTSKPAERPWRISCRRFSRRQCQRMVAREEEEVGNNFHRRRTSAIITSTVSRSSK